MKTFPHLTLSRFLLPSSARQVADVGLICTVGLSTQDLAVQLQILKSVCSWILVGRSLASHRPCQ
ncbi:rCG31440, partial [Rattus norvegicus]